MRTKTLLLSAVALAAGMLSSQAQSNVFSANVVGYVTFTSSVNAPKFQLINNPLLAATNTILGLFPTAPGGTQILLWNGTAYNTAIFSAAQGGHWKIGGVNSDTTPINPGTGFFISVAGANTYSNTFVGSVLALTGQSVTNPVPANLQLVGPQLPYGDNSTNTTTINLTGVTGGTQVLTWDPVGQAFTTFIWSAAQGGHWKVSGVNSNLVINVNQGIFLDAAAQYNWVETLNLQ